MEEKVNNRINDFNFVLSERRIELLKRRGFYVQSPKVIDDHFYSDKNNIWRHSFLRSGMPLSEVLCLPYEQMEEELFKKDSVYPQEVCTVYRHKSFRQYFGGDTLFYDISPDRLDPYVARYVRAVNRCGIKTYYSCDGWHRSRDKSRRAFIDFDGRYSRIWHKLLCSRIDVPEFCRWEHYTDDAGGGVKIDLPGNDEGKKRVYRSIALMADEFDRNRAYYQMLKIYVVDRVDLFDMDDLLDEDAEKIFERMLSEVYAKLSKSETLE